jgi:hypothetical protein
MSNSSKFSVREWMVPPVLLPFFFVLLIPDRKPERESLPPI